MIDVRRAGAALVATFLFPLSAQAGDPFEIQVYDGTADAAGALGLELHINDWASGNRAAPPPSRPLHGQFHMTLEPSFGVLPFWELGAYVQSAVRTDDGIVDWAGAKLRSKFVTPPGWNARWRLGLNLELAYLPQTYDPNRWGSELRPIVAWHNTDWLLVFNPILDQSLGGADASGGPSLQPAVKIARSLGHVALGIEYYATLGPLSAIARWSEQEQRIFEVLDLLSVDHFELNVGIGEGLTQSSAGIVVKAIVGYDWETNTFELPRDMHARK